MADRPERITKENALSVDVDIIAKDRRFDELTFSNARKKIPKVQKWFVEANELGAAELLIPSDINIVNDLTTQLVGLLENLLTFEIRTTNDTALAEHNALEDRIDSFYNAVYQQLPMRILPFLRQETVRASTDVEELEKQRKGAAQAQRDYETLKEQISAELEEIRSRRSEVEQEQGELVAIALGRDFGNQATEYQTLAKKWLEKRDIWFRLLFIIIGGNVLLYLALLCIYSFDSLALSPEEVFTWQYAVAKVALLLLLSYAVGFSSRNYNINSGLAATNRHRKNVAEVLLNALSSSLSEDAKREIVPIAAVEMFKHLPVGYINREHQNDSGPILEVIKRVPGTRSSI